MHGQLELKFSRQQLIGQKPEIKAQNDTIRQRRFENTFFQMLNLLDSTIDSIDLRKKSSGTIQAVGRAKIPSVHSHFIERKF